METRTIKMGRRWMLAMSLTVGLLAVAALLLTLPSGETRADDPAV